MSFSHAYPTFWMRTSGNDYKQSKITEQGRWGMIGRLGSCLRMDSLPAVLHRMLMNCKHLRRPGFGRSQISISGMGDDGRTPGHQRLPFPGAPCTHEMRLGQTSCIL